MSCRLTTRAGNVSETIQISGWISAQTGVDVRRKRRPSSILTNSALIRGVQRNPAGRAPHLQYALMRPVAFQARTGKAKVLAGSQKSGERVTALHLSVAKPAG